MSQHVLDADVRQQDYQALRRRFSMVKVGDGFGYPSISDSDIRRELHHSKQTFHTQDLDFYHPRYRHPTYCLVFYGVEDQDFASCVQRFLCHPQFNTRAKRMGKVVRVTLEQIEVGEFHRENRGIVEWH